MLAENFLYIYTTLTSIMPDKNMCASILFFFIGFISMAQGAAPPPPMPPPPPGLPIDGGVIALLIVALFYGAIKIYRLSKPEA